jgi:hypothetical protein
MWINYNKIIAKIEPIQMEPIEIVLEKVNVCGILPDPKNVRTALNRDNIEGIKQNIKNRICNDPIHIRYVKNKSYYTDGMHRLTAHKELGISHIYMLL